LPISSGFQPDIDAHRTVHPQQREDKVAKGQLRSNREKKKPKADKNKKKGAAAASPFAPPRLSGNALQGDRGKK
jgi:hypothetical protein